MIPLLVIACACFTAACMWFETRRLAVAGVAKVAASFCFIMAALVSGALDSTLGQFVLGGLVLSALGDALLLSTRRMMFLGGMAAFGAAHLAYTAGFVATSWPWSPQWPRPSGAAVLLCGIALRWLWPKVLPQWRGPVLAYGLVIMTMVGAASLGTVDGDLPKTILAGAILFAVSDVSVALDRLTAEERRTRLWGLPLYYAAQLLLAVSV